MEFSTVELLTCSQLQNNDSVLADIDLLQKGLGKEIGWHYYVDLIWVVNLLRKRGINPGATILDAGAGNGLLQYLLAMYGYKIISADYSPRRTNIIIDALFKIEKKNSHEQFTHPYISHLQKNGFKDKVAKLWFLISQKRISLLSFCQLFRKLHSATANKGEIIHFQVDMQSMKDIPDNSVDAVVSISAIEHMDIKSIEKAILEFNRIVKKDQPIVITTSASKSHDWFHEQSKGWCFSLKTLVNLFSLDEINPKTINNYDEILSEYKVNSFIKDHLASEYRLTRMSQKNKNKWEPQYIPVGILTFKKTALHGKGIS